MFALITHLLSIRAKTSWKMLIDNNFRAQTLTRNPTGNYRCQILASCVLSMSCSFSQSALSIESSCVVYRQICDWTCHIPHWQRSLGLLEQILFNIWHALYDRDSDGMILYMWCIICVLWMTMNILWILLKWTELVLKDMGIVGCMIFGVSFRCCSLRNI